MLTNMAHATNMSHRLDQLFQITLAYSKAEKGFDDLSERQRSHYRNKALLKNSSFVTSSQFDDAIIFLADRIKEERSQLKAIKDKKIRVKVDRIKVPKTARG